MLKKSHKTHFDFIETPDTNNNLNLNFVDSNIEHIYIEQMGIYLSTPKTRIHLDKVRYSLSSMQEWCATMEDAPHLDLDASTSFFGVYNGHGNKAVGKFYAKYLHQLVFKN